MMESQFEYEEREADDMRREQRQKNEERYADWPLFIQVDNDLPCNTQQSVDNGGDYDPSQQQED